ncbi:MAG: hypothetical protein RML94_00015 [Bacteroidia bacterium]|nr:hypothetical protein [Bacteroidia bacterium]
MKRRRRVYFGDWVSDVSGELLRMGQKGFWVSSGFSGRGGGEMGGFLHGGIHSRVGDYGYDVYGMGGDLVFSGRPIPWQRKEMDLSNVYKLLGQFRQPVGLGKLFDISGINLKDLLPSDIPIFNGVVEALRNRYLGELQRLSPNLTQEDLMRPDINFKVNELTMKFKGHVQQLYNELLSNKKQFEADADVRANLEKEYGANKVALGLDYDEHLEVSRNSSFKNYLRRYGGDIGAAVEDMVGELEATGTLSGLTRLTAIRGGQPLNLMEDYKRLSDNIKPDSRADIEALNAYAYKTTKVSELGMGKIKSVARSSVGSILNNEKNFTEISNKAATHLNDVLGRVVFYRDNLVSERNRMKGIFEGEDGEYLGLQNMISNFHGMSKEERESWLRALDVYLMTNKKRDIVKVERSVLLKGDPKEVKKKFGEGINIKTIDGKNYLVEEDYVLAYMGDNDKPSLKKEYVLRQKREGGEEDVVIDEEDYRRNKERYKDAEVLEIRETPVRVIDLDEKDILGYVKGLKGVNANAFDIAKNVAQGEIYKNFVSYASSKVGIESEIKVDLRDATNISVKAVGKEGGEIREDNIGEWASFVGQRIVSKNDPDEFNKMIATQFSSRGDLLSNLDGSKDKKVYVIKSDLQTSTLAEGLTKQRIDVYAWYDMNTGEFIRDKNEFLKKNGAGDIEDVKKSASINMLGMAFKVNNKLQLFKLPEEALEKPEVKFKAVLSGSGSANDKEVGAVISGALDYYVKDPDQLKVVGIETKNVNKEQLINIITGKLATLELDARYSFVNKMMAHYLHSTNEGVMGGIVDIGGVKVFVEHSGETLAGVIGAQFETARNATFTDRYKYLLPVIGTINKINNKGGFQKISGEEIEEINKFNKDFSGKSVDELKKVLDNVGDPNVKKIVAKRILKDLNQLSRHMYADNTYVNIAGYNGGKIDEQLFKKAKESAEEKIKYLEEVVGGDNKGK